MRKSLDLPQVEPISLTTEQATAANGIPRSSLYALISSGELPSCLVRGRRLIPLDALKEFLRKRVEAQAGEPVDPEVAKKKSKAGKAGRAAQIAEAT